MYLVLRIHSMLMSSIAILHVVCILIGTGGSNKCTNVVTAFSQKFNSITTIQQQEVSGGFPKKLGVTSLLKLPYSGRIIAGTKSGRVFYSDDYDDDKKDVNNNNSNNSTLWYELEGYDTKFPIFSLESSAEDEEETLFCGGGDRYISVWRKSDSSINTSSSKYSWSERLGPHTGWVKALAYEKETKVLFSIGCNCIESWDCSSGGSSTSSGSSSIPENNIRHITKRSIENSPEYGCTLSSDLLCLFLMPEDCRRHRRLLLSGGVDGRVHVWSSSDDLSVPKPIFSQTIHDGRVNRLLFVVINMELKLKLGLALGFSMGNDGKLVAFEVREDHLLIKGTLHLDGMPRITAGLAIKSTRNNNHCTIVLGTADGEIIFVEARVSDDSEWKVSMKEVERFPVCNNGEMIYALENCSNKDDKSISLLVGHASGLVHIDYSLNTDE